MTQCPYTDELYKTENEEIVAGRYGKVIIATGHACTECLVEYVTKIANDLVLDELTEYNVLQEESGNVAVTLSTEQMPEEQLVKTLHKLYDQELACANCNMSRSMDRWHGLPEAEVEKVTLEDNQIIAYGHVQTLMTYEEAKKHILWYLEHTGDQGEAMLADIGYSGYEIVLRHVMIGDTHYAGDSDYINTDDAQKLVDEGLADYMEFVEG